MAKKIKGEDGKIYKRIQPEDPNRKRTLEIIVGVIGLVLSLMDISHGMFAANFADTFGGGGEYTTRITFGLIFVIAAFVLLFFIKKNRKLIGWLVLALGFLFMILCGDYGLVGGIIFMVDGILILVRK
ncbi:MAG TPA: hypothetical protein H9721_07770 [Candidatus Limosilactobacillus intestinipullorum]|nr:hypothetical protein [Candidatus Limosilactobacillus intestinipullorum]